MGGAQSGTDWGFNQGGSMT